MLRFVAASGTNCVYIMRNLLPLLLMVLMVVGKVKAAFEQPKALQSKRTKPVPFVATTSTVEHGRALSQFLRPGDRVLELGTQLDECSRLICNKVGSAVLVDVARTETNSGRSSSGTRDPDLIVNSGSDNVEYVELEQFSQYKSFLDDAVATESPFDIMVLDTTAITGNDLVLRALSVIMDFVDDTQRRGKHRPRCVIVKSKAISSLSRRLIHAQRLFDGTIVRDLKSPSRDGKPYIIAGVGVEEYRRAIPYAVKEGDACIEVGCFSGTTTQLVHDAAKARASDSSGDMNGLGYCLGVDIGPKIIDRARREHPDICFEVGNAWKSLELLRMKRKVEPTTDMKNILGGYDCVFVDVGGISGPDGVLDSLSLIDGLGYGLEPRCIIIKSLCMKRLASSLRAFSTMWETERRRDVLVDINS